MSWDILHRMHYVYATPVRDSFSDVRLEPLSNAGQTVESFSLRISPAATANRYADFYGNWIHHFEILDEHLFLLVESRARVRTHPLPPLPLDAEPCPIGKLENVRWIDYCHDFLQSSRHVEVGAKLLEPAADVIAGQTDVWQSTLALMRFVHGFLKYDGHSDKVQSRIQDVIARRRGTPRDFAHLMMGLCREAKIPARYVSGYLAAKPDGVPHAWVEVFIPTAGWIGLDPTHNRQPDSNYVKIAVGRDYADVPSIAANHRGAPHRKVEMDVTIEKIA